ncbi:MAG: outer membrane beta-barrel family protein [Flavobacteriaceae bacterium]|nr:outer membrane beta-barrel family protein [Flavobacteriaceae bacterium]
MKSLFAILGCFGLLFLGIAQQPSGNRQGFNRGNLNPISVSGQIVSQQSKESLAYATVLFRNSRFSNRPQGGITDENGLFEIEIVPGDYVIEIEFIGFESLILDQQSYSETTDLGVIELALKSKELDEIELVGERTTVEIKLDKKIYNVGSDITVRGGSVSDVLDNVPSVSVDVEGNVALRGNNNVRILINGKPSGLVGLSGPQGLRSLPAESIEQVEVITSPSARYSAEGTAGILNIILKKQDLYGINGNLIGSIGEPDIASGSATLNWRREKFNLFTTNSYNYSNNSGYFSNNNTYYNIDAEGVDQPDTFLSEYRDANRNRNSYFTTLGLEYFFNEKTSIIFSGFYRSSDGKDRTPNEIEEFDSHRNRVSFTERVELEEEKDISKQISLNFFKDYEQRDHRLTATLQYEESSEDELANISNQTIFPLNSPLQREKNITIEDDRRILVQSDYVKPYDNGNRFEIGFRGNYTNQLVDYQVSLTRNNSDFILDTDLSNVLEYKEYITAGYSQYGIQFDKFGILMGLRVEHSQITINQRTSNDLNTKDYTDFFPTVNLSLEASEQTSYQLGYSRRVRRPRSRYINPFPSRSSVTNIFQGNPDIDPTYSNAFDLGLLRRWDKMTFNASTYYSKATDSFVFINEDTGMLVTISGDPDDPNSQLTQVPVIRRSPVNLTSNIRWGTEFTLSWFPSSDFRLNGNFNLFHSSTKGSYSGLSYDASNLSWFGRLNATIQLPFDIDLQLRGFYFGPSEDAINKRRGNFIASGALNKRIFKDKGTISFRASDIFNTSIRQIETFAPTFYSETEIQWRPPTFVLSISYIINERRENRRRSQGRGNDGGGFQDGEGFDF